MSILCGNRCHTDFHLLANSTHTRLFYARSAQISVLRPMLQYDRLYCVAQHARATQTKRKPCRAQVHVSLLPPRLLRLVRSSRISFIERAVDVDARILPSSWCVCVCVCLGVRTKHLLRAFFNSFRAGVVDVGRARARCRQRRCRRRRRRRRRRRQANGFCKTPPTPSIPTQALLVHGDFLCAPRAAQCIMILCSCLLI